MTEASRLMSRNNSLRKRRHPATMHVHRVALRKNCPRPISRTCSMLKGLYTKTMKKKKKVEKRIYHRPETVLPNISWICCSNSGWIAIVDCCSVFIWPKNLVFHHKYTDFA